jgi:hypothetical protein
MMLKASRNQTNDDPVLETMVAARLSALAAATPSEGAMAAARQRLITALAAAGPAGVSGGRGRRIGITTAAAIGALGAVSAVGAATGNEGMKSPITAIQAVAERAGLAENGQQGYTEDAAHPAGITFNSAGANRNQDVPAAVERERPAWLPLGNGGWSLPGAAKPETVPSPAQGDTGQGAQPSDGPGKSSSNNRGAEGSNSNGAGQGPGNGGNDAGQGQAGNGSPAKAGEHGQGNQNGKPVAAGPRTTTPQPGQSGLGTNQGNKPTKPGQSGNSGRGQGGPNR